jgi:molecular chaperone Hsp33
MREPDRDRVVITVTHDGCFRVVTARTVATVNGAIRAQGARGSTAERFADLMTASALVRIAIAPNVRVQTVFRGTSGRSILLVDCHPDGGCRGIVMEPENSFELGPGCLLQVIRFLPNGSLQQGVTEVPVGSGISGALMAYMLESEQVWSMIGVGSVVEEDRVVLSGGWLVQRLPECDESSAEQMAARMRDEFADVKRVLREVSADPEALQLRILAGFPFRQTASVELDYRCYCSPTRVYAGIATLGRAELEDILKKREILNVRCNYCGTPYTVHPESLRGLIEAS